MPSIIQEILKKMWQHKKIAANAIIGLAVAFLLSWGITNHVQNKKLSQELEMAQNNVEAYQGALDGSQQAFNVLKLDMEELQYQNDKLIHEIDSVRKENKIKSNSLQMAATQTQIIDVNDSKGVKGDIITILKDTVYTDTLQYNPLTKVYYSIGTDSVWVRLDIKNTQYLYIYHSKEYKNKKNFFKRLFTLDFKKITRYKYKIVNTNDLIKEESIRIIEQK